MTALLHLIDPADWRTALDAGAVRPPSLAAAGFVHLSTAGQVHLPAARLFPGRRDLVLLVVDPDRLADPVRYEPGVPGDPATTRFPHLYGPLPTAAVVAVVPYLPPAEPVLPAPDDALGRALASALSLRVRRAAEVRDVPGGIAVLDPARRHSRDDNRLLLSHPVDADTVEETAASIAREAGLRHRSATLRWSGAAQVAGQLAARGWDVEEVVAMARPGPPPIPGCRAVRVEPRELHDLWRRSWYRELRAPPDREGMVGRLVEEAHRTDRVVAVHDYAVVDPAGRGGGRPVAAGRLRIDGATAVVDSVLTDPAARGRGHADAVLGAALDGAAAAGCDLVVLEAAARDWQRSWYARRGFTAVGSVWEVGAGPAGAG